MTLARRGYAKFKNDFYINGKARELRAVCPSALGAFVFIVTYCSDNLTDGRISDRDLRYTLGVTSEEIKALCSVEMLEPDSAEGYMVHDYTDHNSTRSQVEKKSIENTQYYQKKKKHSYSSSSEGHFSNDSDTIQQSESDLNRTKHKNTRTQEHSSKDESPYSPPQGTDCNGVSRWEPSEEPNLQFKQFWSLYPNHDYPDAAVREFRRVRRKGVKLEALMQGAQILANEHRDPKYIPTASRWLHDGGWNNKPKPPGQAQQTAPNRSQQNQDANAALIVRYAQEEAEQAGREITDEP
ncbi:hypothetical protein [Bombiscardovia coagulans]|uniref:Replisome organizer n=1 Tax=Bombiscardovia coagulans TaxID=686666 RepID=A0A261ESQ0_9BIFI|nr:hypothetical protein [Bombiscardovia coagulans]OZG49887.1 hypothetical protein BOCO_0404 [Bombiscardovia coagulans]